MNVLESVPFKVRLHDPQRKSSNWTACLLPTQYAIFITHAKFGYELTSDGVPKPRSVPSYCLVFNSLNEAEAFCIEFVKSMSDARCDVYDHRGKSKPPLASFTHPRHAGRVANRRSAYRMCFFAGLMVLPAPILFWIDWRVRGVLIIPTLTGLTLITAAFRILLWAFGMLEAVQAREERRARQ